MQHGQGVALLRLRLRLRLKLKSLARIERLYDRYLVITPTSGERLYGGEYELREEEHVPGHVGLQAWARRVAGLGHIRLQAGVAGRRE